MHPAPVDYFKMTNDMINIYYNRYMSELPEEMKEQLVRIAADFYRGVSFDDAKARWAPVAGPRAFSLNAIVNLAEFERYITRIKARLEAADLPALAQRLDEASPDAVAVLAPAAAPAAPLALFMIYPGVPDVPASPMAGAGAGEGAESDVSSNGFLSDDGAVTDSESDSGASTVTLMSSDGDNDGELPSPCAW